MMPQTILPFKLETTDEQFTPHGGLALFGEFLHAMNVPRQLNAALPAPGSHVGYHAAQYIIKVTHFFSTAQNKIGGFLHNQLGRTEELAM